MDIFPPNLIGRYYGYDVMSDNSLLSIKIIAGLVIFYARAEEVNSFQNMLDVMITKMRFIECRSFKVVYRQVVHEYGMVQRPQGGRQFRVITDVCSVERLEYSPVDNEKIKEIRLTIDLRLIKKGILYAILYQYGKIFENVELYFCQKIYVMIQFIMSRINKFHTIAGLITAVEQYEIFSFLFEHVNADPCAQVGALICVLQNNLALLYAKKRLIFAKGVFANKFGSALFNLPDDLADAVLEAGYIQGKKLGCVP